ncbi:MAG: glucose-6-phosphate isomerase [Rhodospirillaceae bacterium]
MGSPQSWSTLKSLAKEAAGIPIKALFDRDPDRFSRFSQTADGLLLDYSKTNLSPEALQTLETLAQESGLADRRQALFSGAAINSTENRAVLHVALRAPLAQDDADPVLPVPRVDGQDVREPIADVLARMRHFANGIRDGSIAASDGAPFTDVINIGIGGSDLGPVMVTRALRPYHDGPRLHFVSNVDGAHMADTLAPLDPARTLIIVASKTFTTIETITNADSAWSWLVGALGEDKAGQHVAALSTALDKVGRYRVPEDRVFGFWDWVGGRYSVWSAIGLPVMIAIGPEDFDAFRAGGHAMDRHFFTAPALENLPILMGLLGVWHRNGMGMASRAVLPYDQRLERLPAYLQQLDMESNGKQVALDGTALSQASGPVVWGEPGTNGQHAFFQLLHQGTDITPCEFLVAARGHEPEMDLHHRLLLANCLAQSEAMMLGRSAEDVRARMIAAGKTAKEADALAPHRAFPGNRPSTTLLYEKLDPETLGKIVALYEHRVFVEGCLWGLNSYDQWGVELGKERAMDLLPLVGMTDGPDLDAVLAGKDGSTGGLISEVRTLRKKGNP